MASVCAVYGTRTRVERERVDHKTRAGKRLYLLGHGGGKAQQAGEENDEGESHTQRRHVERSRKLALRRPWMPENGLKQPEEGLKAGPFARICRKARLFDQSLRA